MILIEWVIFQVAWFSDCITAQHLSPVKLFSPPACHVHLSKRHCLKLPTAFCPTKSDPRGFLFGCHAYGNATIIKLHAISNAIHLSLNVFKQVSGIMTGVTVWEQAVEYFKRELWFCRNGSYLPLQWMSSLPRRNCYSSVNILIHSTRC